MAEVTETGYDGVHRFAFPGEPEQDFHVDCAVARLLDESAMPDGEVAFRVGRVHPHDALPHRRLPVRLLGVHAGPPATSSTSTPPSSGPTGRSCPGTIVIRTRAGRPPFATEGDSGALVVDRHDRAVGLLWGVAPDRPHPRVRLPSDAGARPTGRGALAARALATLAEDS